MGIIEKLTDEVLKKLCTEKVSLQAFNRKVPEQIGDDCVYVLYKNGSFVKSSEDWKEIDRAQGSGLLANYHVIGLRLTTLDVSWVEHIQSMDGAVNVDINFRFNLSTGADIDRNWKRVIQGLIGEELEVVKRVLQAGLTNGKLVNIYDDRASIIRDLNGIISSRYNAETQTKQHTLKCEVLGIQAADTEIHSALESQVRTRVMAPGLADQQRVRRAQEIESLEHERRLNQERLKRDLDNLLVELQRKQFISEMEQKALQAKADLLATEEGRLAYMNPDQILEWMTAGLHSDAEKQVLREKVKFYDSTRQTVFEMFLMIIGKR